jgi:hypothetical protein
MNESSNAVGNTVPVGSTTEPSKVEPTAPPVTPVQPVVTTTPPADVK